MTSSYPTIGGVLIGLGTGLHYIERVLGVVKAYQTRVGAGPMPTELEGELGSSCVAPGASLGTSSALPPAGPGVVVGSTAWRCGMPSASMG